MLNWFETCFSLKLFLLKHCEASRKSKLKLLKINFKFCNCLNCFSSCKVTKKLEFVVSNFICYFSVISLWLRNSICFSSNKSVILMSEFLKVYICENYPNYISPLLLKLESHKLNKSLCILHRRFCFIRK